VDYVREPIKLNFAPKPDHDLASVPTEELDDILEGKDNLDKNTKAQKMMEESLAAKTALLTNPTEDTIGRVVVRDRSIEILIDCTDLEKLAGLTFRITRANGQEDFASDGEIKSVRHFDNADGLAFFRDFLARLQDVPKGN